MRQKIEEFSHVVLIKRDGQEIIRFDPYFYSEIQLDDPAIIEQKKVEHAGLPLYKVSVKTPQDVVRLRNERTFEDDIPYLRRYLIDNEVNFIEDEPNIAAFDIEVLAPLTVPNSKRDPIICFSVWDKNGGRTYTWREHKGEAEIVPTETALIKKFFEVLQGYDFVVGYNSSLFDLPYIRERAKELGVSTPPIRKKRKGHVTYTDVEGLNHIDLISVVYFFGSIGAMRLREYSLESVYHQLGGEAHFKEIKASEIPKYWKTPEGRATVLHYNRRDAEVTYIIAQKLLPVVYELSRLLHLPPVDVSLSTTGQLVEFLLMKESKKRDRLIPSKPHGAEIRERLLRPIEGAFVKMPEPGIYSNIAVFDFRSLYPSIICTYNISPETLDPNGEYLSPVGHRFKKSPKGLFPDVLEELITKRAEIKKRLKSLEGEAYKKEYARSQALKILANSFYGYLIYARSRWYSRECGESITAWARHHIKHAIQMVESRGYKVLYADTDSLFILMGDHTKEEVLALLDEINRSLPGMLELELEDFYTRAIFVSKRSGERGAKKKYAMINEKGEIKIRGFELVRRDWSAIARKAQQRVLEIILKEGSKEKAIAAVREIIKQLKEGKVDLQDLVIYTRLKKDPRKYESIGPEVSAALKARQIGLPYGKDSVIGYVITKHGQTISEKAYPVEMAKDYDAEYYIKNQVLPAVMRIVKELGITEDELLGRESVSLDSFLSEG